MRESEFQKFFKSLRIYSDEFNVHLEGATITINGKQHELMMELRSVTITMSEIDDEIPQTES